MANVYVGNTTFPVARTNINNALNNIDTLNAGAMEPSSTQAYTLWLDTSSTPVLKVRNGANNAWIILLAYTGPDASTAPWFVNESDMISSSALRVPSQKSVKDYVDGAVGTSSFIKAWVNFNGTGTPAIRQSYNISSIVDLSRGRYQLNFTNALVDTQYVIAGSGMERNGSASPRSSHESIVTLDRESTMLTTSVTILNANINGSNNVDGDVITVMVIR